MSFAAPFALILIAPLAGAVWLLRWARIGGGSGLTGAWAEVIRPSLRAIVAARSGIAAAKASRIGLMIGVLIVAALSRPGLDLREGEDFSSIAGRVVVLDIGADLARHRQFMDALSAADPGAATAVVASAGDAYRITPFTTDRAQTDRYVRVLSADMMPRPGTNLHLGLARAERMLDEAGYPVRQILILSARGAPAERVAIPPRGSERIVVALDQAADLTTWAEAQGAEVKGRDAAAEIADAFSGAARALARSELPAARMELTTPLVALAAALWLFLFRRRAG